MKFNTGKTEFISFPLKTKSIAFCNKSCFTHTACSHCVTGLGVHIDPQLHFHNHVEQNVAQTFKIPGLTRYIRPPFFTTEQLVILYSTLVRPKLEFASVA
jgi:hypothetical protein